MAKVTDVQGYDAKFKNQRSKLEDADIDDRDRAQIERWLAHLRTNDPQVDSLGTVVGHLNRIRLAAERAHLPLVEFENVDDVNAFELHLRDVHGLSDGTIRNYRKSVKKFFRWLHGEDSWADAITIGTPIQREHDPADNITADELKALFDACTAFESTARDRAMIALLRDTGLRIGAVLSLQMKHVDLETARGTLKINTDANVKGASGEKPVTWSRSYVSNWIDEHPRPDDDEAPLIHKSGTYWDPDDPDDDGALRQQYAGARITRIAEEAGLDSDRITAHLFRGTAISEWILDDIKTPAIEHRVDWVKGSRQRRVYQRVGDREFNERIHDHYGIEAEDDEGAGAPYKLDVRTCPVCESALSGTESHCPQCGAPIESAREVQLEDVDGDVQEYMIDESAKSKREYAAEMASDIRDDTALLRALLEELADEAD